MKLFKFIRLHKSKGNTLIELLFAMSIVLMISLVIGSLFLNLKDVDFNYNQDIAYGIYELTYEISEADHVDVSEEVVTLYNQNSISYISLNNHRIVRTPGFIIYLHHIDDVSFSHDNFYVYMHLKRGEIDETFKIGLYYRAQIGVYECDCDDYISDDFNDDSIDESIDSNQSQSIP